MDTWMMKSIERSEARKLEEERCYQESRRARRPRRRWLRRPEGLGG
jgi:hypothetical protein